MKRSDLQLKSTPIFDQMLTRFFKGHQQRASNEKCQTINQKNRFIRNSSSVVDLFSKVVLRADDVYIRFQYNVVYWLLPAEVYNSVQYDLFCDAFFITLYVRNIF